MIKRTLIAAVVALAFAAPAAAVSMTTTVNRSATVSPDGIVTVSGTVSCFDFTSQAFASFEILMEQTKKGDFADSATQASTPCGPTPTAWSAVLGSFETVPFRPGKADVHVTPSACDADVTECVFASRIDRLVRLHH